MTWGPSNKRVNTDAAARRWLRAGRWAHGRGIVTYFSTFIEVAPDTTAITGTIPPSRSDKKSIAFLEYELISNDPHGLTQEDVQFAVHVQRAGIPVEQIEGGQLALREVFFSKPHACLRASPLPKSYGWGLHFDECGKVALVAMDSARYEQLASDAGLSHTLAMRSRRA